MEEVEQTVSHFLAPLIPEGQGILVVIDGKTLHGTIPTGSNQGVHLLAAYLPGQGIVLMQVAVESKENEIKVAPRLQEDGTRMTDPTQARAMAIINNLVIALTRQDGFTNLPAARRYYNAHLPAALKLLLSGFAKM